MAKYTKEDILRILEENDVKFIRLQFSDIFGSLKNVAITRSQAKKALDNECMFDGSSIEGFVRIEESDMYLRPDLDTFCILPWHKKGKIARLICDVYKPDGTPFEGDPRSILRRVLQEAAQMGYTFNVGPECEFFLFNRDEHGHSTTVTYDTAGYFDMGPSDVGESCRRDICLILEEMGFEIEASHHECAVAQHEIDFKYSEALTAADNIHTFKMVVKSAADAHGVCATFMPKPLFGEAGSGMHTNMSLFKDGKNAFYDPESPNGLSHIALNFIAGILHHIKGVSAITNPLVNSYKRLVPGCDAPVSISWSEKSNRSSLIRIPSSRGDETRIELRSPDSAANPYLALAVCLAAGLDGIRRNLKEPKSLEGNVFQMDREKLQEKKVELLPRTMGEAIEEFQKDPFIRQVLGDHIFCEYLEAKQDEWIRFRAAVTDWEREEYLYRF